MWYILVKMAHVNVFQLNFLVLGNCLFCYNNMKCVLPSVFMRFFCIGNLKMKIKPKVEMYLLGESMVKWTNNVPCTKNQK